MREAFKRHPRYAWEITGLFIAQVAILGFMWYIPTLMVAYPLYMLVGNIVLSLTSVAWVTVGFRGFANA